MGAALIGSIAGIERALAELRADGDAPAQRTSVLTHVAWVPAEWTRAADEILEALGERYPSRTILLHPQPDAEGAGLEAEVERECFAGSERSVCAEVIRIHLRGRSAAAPATVVEPLLLPDLPVFLRWRGLPSFESAEYVQLTGIADRLIVDSGEWPEPRYRELAGSFGRTAVSDLAWRRTLGWRARIAERWPLAGERLRVTGPRAEATLLAGWLRSRLRHDVAHAHRPAGELEEVSVDGCRVPAPAGHALSPADQLSAELDVFGRNPVYEQAVTAA